MDFGTLLDLIGTLSLAGGLLFAGVQWRESRREGGRRSQLQVLRTFETPEFVRAMRRVLALPPDLSREELEARLGPGDLDLLWYWLGVMESLGVYVHDRYVNIHDVAQTYGGPVIVSFRQLRRYVEGVRAEVGRDSMHEWFEWLANQLERLERDEGRQPAYVREAGWRP
jgi:hypothetical protein